MRRKIRTAAVIGSGVMGGGIAALLAAGNTTFYKTGNGKRFYYDFDGETYKEQVVGENVISLTSLKSTGNVVKENGSVSLVDLGDEVFCLELHSKMNSLNREIIEFLPEVLETVDANAAGLVIGNQAGAMPGAFCAGANL